MLLLVFNNLLHSRVSQYVFVPTKDIFFNTLDQHADTLEGDRKPPLVLIGDEGSGKSALLANWVAKRREHKHRDEFLFQHFVGCTTQSLQLLHTLHRLESDLKSFFNLREMKVPETEVELRWSLNRFLEAASKKHSPARIVIIIDGINRLKAEGAPDGALHWLPTELPPCVRFIVSTVENERKFRGGKKENTQHRTYVELMRRQCPTFRVEQLGMGTRHNVIKDFAEKLSPERRMEFTEQNIQFKIVTAEHSGEPMYLRSLLQALRLATELTSATTDQLLDKFLTCKSAHELIDKNLNICCQASLSEGGEDDDEDGEENLLTDLLGKMMSMVYVSRSGLTESEIWGLLRIVSNGVEPDEAQAKKLITILKDFTMVVNNMHSFSHEIYREVVYHKYISSREQLIKWHTFLARYFGQLPPCDRKLVALPYHLEMAGSWRKVKNCLTDIEMFQLWWTPKFKADFIKFWASLTRISHSASRHAAEKRRDNRRHGDATETEVSGGSSRPTFDIVEEYVKSLDEYRSLKHPSDEAVAGIILEIGDFLLEFATLRHEVDADVPALIHPKVLSEDLRSIGVPYIEIDEEGRSSLVYPEILHSFSNKQQSDDGPAIDAPTKAIEDVPVCTTYYFYRWMWIQFPYIALGNCDARYTAGVNKKLADMADTHGRVRKGDTDLRGGSISQAGGGGGVGSNGSKAGRSVGTRDMAMSMSMSMENLKLPQIKFNRKAAKSVPRISKDDVDEIQAASNKVTQRLEALQDSIQNYREEYDFVVQMKNIVNRRLQDLKDNLIDLKRTAESCSQFDGELELATKREAEAAAKYESVKTLNKNLVNLVLMCDRHPANVPALITDLHNKIEQDAYLIKEIKKRLWEQKFEKQTHSIMFRHMKNLVQEAVKMHGELLEHKVAMSQTLAQRAAEDEKALNTTKKQNSSDTLLEESHSSSIRNSHLAGGGKHAASAKLSRLGPGDKNGMLPAVQSDSPTAGKSLSWEETWSIISSRTGIIEPEAFFQRVNNSTALVEQINTIKKTSEGRLEQLKREVVAGEVEFEEERNKASFAGVQSSKEKKKQLTEKQSQLRQIQEKTEAMEQLEQRVVAGLAHISDILFIPKSEDDAPVLNLVRDIEAVLDTLINEREKQVQQQQGTGQASAGGIDSPSRMLGGRDSNSVIPETHANRSPELDMVIAKHEQPKIRLPARLPSRHGSVILKKGQQYEFMLNTKPIAAAATSTADEEEIDEEGTWNRAYVKTTSINSLKSEMKKAAKINRSDSKKINMLSTL